ncbi:MAG: hypothetical protein ABW061_27910 [Polyangiaceae bacterium]
MANAEAVGGKPRFGSESPSAPHGPTVDTSARVDAGGPSLIRNLKLALLIRRFAAQYFAQLDVEYDSLCPDEYKAAHSSELAQLRANNARRPSWSTNHRLEYLLLGGLPFAILRQRSLVHRARLLALVGPEASAAFSAAFPAPTSDPNAVDALRTESLGVLMEIQRLRHVQTEFERLRNRLIAISMVPGFVFVLLALRYSELFWRMPLAQIAATLGFLGGYLSVLLRVGALRWSLKYAANYQQVDRLFWNVFLNFYLSLLEGSLGAIVLYIAFSTGLFTVGLFPAIPGGGKGVLMADALNHADLTRLMLWSIVAGFSERAVPDFLSGLSKELTVKQPPNTADSEADKTKTA